MKPIVAILYDFDSTLSSSDMQNFGFIPSLGMSPEEFWKQTQEFGKKNNIERTLAYLYMMCKLAKKKGIKMDYEWLKKQGERIQFFPGVIEWFSRINEYGKQHGVKVEHYLVSSGNKEIVEGCKIAKEFKVIYGCEFYFDPVTGEPIWPKLAINYTQKTQYFYRVAKGAIDATDDSGVNNKVKQKRIQYSNFVYVGDGMTDIPSMIIVKNNGGKSIAVYREGEKAKVQSLVDDGRVNYAVKADYRANSKIEKIVQLVIQNAEINASLSKKESQVAD